MVSPRSRKDRNVARSLEAPGRRRRAIAPRDRSPIDRRSKNTGRRGEVNLAASRQVACAPALESSNLQPIRARSRGDVLEASTTRGQGRSPGGRARSPIDSGGSGRGRTPVRRGRQGARRGRRTRFHASRVARPFRAQPARVGGPRGATVGEPKRPISLAIFVEFRPSPRKDRWDR
jgi:hypothetical protein